jgi:hypothetical protein
VKAVEGWETKRFDEFGTIYSGSTPSTAIRSFRDGDIVWVTPNDLSKLKTPYLSDSGKRITEKGLTWLFNHLTSPHALESCHLVGNWRKVLDIYATSIDYLKTAFAGALPDIS